MRKQCVNKRLWLAILHHIDSQTITEAEMSPSMTNKRLAELVGKDPAMVSKWVTNVAQPNVEMLILISKLLEVSVDE